MNNRPIISRPRYLHLLHAAVAVGSHRFARLAALDWLAAYPGDLAAGYFYGRALAADGRTAQSAEVFEGLRRADPEFVAAVEALADLNSADPASSTTSAGTCLFALTGRCHDRRNLASWGGSLWLGRQALVQGKLDLADEMLRDAQRQAPDEPLVQVSHLNLLRRMTRIDARLGCEIASAYYQRMPDCLPAMLHLAVWLLQTGDEDQAVALLHQAAARDVGGQAAERLWGAEHPYRVLWPERMQLDLRLQIPAEVSAALGWNQLPEKIISSTNAALEEPAALPTMHALDSGPALDTGISNPPPSNPPPLSGNVTAFDPSAAASDDPEATRPTRVRRSESNTSPAQTPPTGELYWALATQDAHAASAATAKSRLEALVGIERHGPVFSPQRKPLDPELKSVAKEMDQSARRMKLPVHGHLDGRFPVYVLLSLRRRLEARYGAGVVALLESEMDALREAVAHRPGWSALTVMADEPAALQRLGLSPVRSGDPWEVKLLLADLDAALARRGQCIGALLIVGGPEIVPFHRLPNPVDDQDPDVASDNPYATGGENYFVPDWPVGRLPGGAGSDARLLLDSLRRIRLAHEAAALRLTWLEKLGAWLGLRFGKNNSHPSRRVGRRLPAFGYTAAVWKAASARVFRPIGRPASLQVSPPRGFDGDTAVVNDDRVPRPFGRLGYFNLHGLADGPEWFGQRDPLDPAEAPDFPVALRPEDVICAAENSERIPRVVFSQACYGLSIQDCLPHQSMALSFLQAGALAVVGSTGMSYGALSAQLAAGDLLAHTFWNGVQGGLPAGEALRQAKIALIAEVNSAQGFIDGEEQKTLISFALIGDPLATAETALRLPKSLRYQENPLLEVATVCEKADAGATVTHLSPEMMTSVRSAVARYLPGMDDAHLSVAHARVTCSGEGHDCPTSRLERRTRIDHAAHQAQLAAGGRKPPLSARRGLSWAHSKNAAAHFDHASVVTLSKSVSLPNGTHPRIARLTLDDSGKIIKMVVSR